MQRGVDFCCQCEDFPCKKLKTEPLLERKEAMIEANDQIKRVGIENYTEQLKERYRQA